MVVDGREVRDISEIKAIGFNFAKVGMEQWQHLVSLPEPELLQKAVWIRCFCFNLMCKTLGLDWQPTPKLLQAVEDKTLEQGWKIWNQPRDEASFKDYWRRMWDPREDFYP